METAKSAPKQISQKVCVHCGRDVSQEKRVKDASGRYACASCHSAVTSMAHNQTGTNSLPATAAESEPPTPPLALSKPEMPQNASGRSVGWIVVGALSMLATLFLLAVIIGIKDDPTVEPEAVGFTTVMLVAFNAFSVIAFTVSDNKTASAIAQMLPKSLQQRAGELGTVKGLSYTQIVAALGSPSSVNYVGQQCLAVWTHQTYQLSLLFEGSGEQARCLGVESEHSF